VALCYSLGTLQPVKAKLYSPYQVEETVDPYWRKQLEEVIFSTEVTLKGYLGQTDLKIRDLLSLETGDIITLDTKVEDLLPVTIENVPKFKAELGVFKGFKALRVKEFLKSED